MKTGDIARTLKIFADFADAHAANEIRLLADYFSNGTDETIAQRIKKSGPVNGYPATLNRALEVLRDGFAAAGAKKQSSAINALLNLFAGEPVLTTTEFLSSLSTPPPKPARPATTKRKATPAVPDHALARTLADTLQIEKLDPPAFNAVVARLGKPKEVNTPTLHLIANQFLGNSKQYKGRKAPIDDIVRRQQEDARDQALERALDRVAV